MNKYANIPEHKWRKAFAAIVDDYVCEYGFGDNLADILGIQSLDDMTDEEVADFWDIEDAAVARVFGTDKAPDVGFCYAHCSPISYKDPDTGMMGDMYGVSRYEELRWERFSMYDHPNESYYAVLIPVTGEDTVDMIFTLEEFHEQFEIYSDTKDGNVLQYEEDGLWHLTSWIGVSNETS